MGIQCCEVMFADKESNRLVCTSPSSSESRGSTRRWQKWVKRLTATCSSCSEALSPFRWTQVASGGKLQLGKGTSFETGLSCHCYWPQRQRTAFQTALLAVDTFRCNVVVGEYCTERCWGKSRHSDSFNDYHLWKKAVNCWTKTVVINFDDEMRSTCMRNCSINSKLNTRGSLWNVKFSSSIIRIWNMQNIWKIDQVNIRKRKIWRYLRFYLHLHLVYERWCRKSCRFLVFWIFELQTFYSGSYFLKNFNKMKFVVEGRRLKVLTKSVRLLARYAEHANIVTNSNGFG